MLEFVLYTCASIEFTRNTMWKRSLVEMFTFIIPLSIFLRDVKQYWSYVNIEIKKVL